MAEYDINYDDKRFKKVESDKTAALKEHEQTYDSMISGSDRFYDKQIQASKDWADTQTKLQNEQTNFAIQEIEQQKAEAKKDYLDEQSGAYADWQKQSDKFGVRAEQFADKGMQNTGYSESSQTAMYNSYQNRVTTALESYNRAIQDFNNGITEARLQNNSALAEIRFKALQQQLQLSLEGFQYKNQLLMDKKNQKLQIEDSYYNRYQDVLNQINAENSLAEQIRQYNESMALEREQWEWQKKKASVGGYSGGSYGGSRSSGSNTYTPTKKNDGSSSSSDSLPADTAKSILALGKGPISAEYAKKLVDSGEATVAQSIKTGNPIFYSTAAPSDSDVKEYVSSLNSIQKATSYSGRMNSLLGR
jgi:hypothetical protein